MATTLMPLDPAMSPQQSTRILAISASLLPEEIVAARRAGRTRGWVIVVAAVVACLCGAWFAYAQDQKQQAEKELATAMTAVTSLQQDQRRFSTTVKVENETALLTQQLKAVLANDLDWAALLDTLRSAGTPSGVEIDGVNGALDVAGAGSSSDTKAMPGTDTAASIGSLVVTGAGPDKKAVAAYVEALGSQTVVTNPYVTSVASSDEGGVTFSLKVDITQASLCGRWTVECKSQGGN